MPSFDNGEEDDRFFDSSDYLEVDDSVYGTEELGLGNLDYEIWFNQLASVNERRQRFLQKMGLAELDMDTQDVDETKEVKKDGLYVGPERLRECSEVTCVSSDNDADENSVFCVRELCPEANIMSDKEFDPYEVNFCVGDEDSDLSCSSNGRFEANFEHEDEYKSLSNLKTKSFWKRYFASKETKSGFNVSKPNPRMRRIKVKQNKKQWSELSAVYVGQEIKAHAGFISCMKFSPDGQYLASAGEGGVVRIWRVTSTAAPCQSFVNEGDFSSYVNDAKSGFGRKKMSQAPVYIPEKVFHIEETPIQEFFGHTSDVLDLAWSRSNILLSSSTDKTVRQWKPDCSKCQNVFHHNNYVTCVEFNPIDENYFISGSIDGKARVWGLSEKRVVSWADARDVISAICYQRDGKGFVVGSVTGNCRFYGIIGNDVELEAQIHIQGRKKNASNKITSIQFCSEKSRRVMIASEDSKLRIYDDVDIVHKFKGLPKSRSQKTASFASSGKHIISVGEDSRVYAWNYDGKYESSSKHLKSSRSCEHFFSEGVSVAVPWSGMTTTTTTTEKQEFSGCSVAESTQTCDRKESGRFSLGSWFTLDSLLRGSATWPEERLPSWDLTIFEDEHNTRNNDQLNCASMFETWGLVIVTAGWDGMIRTFHNYGLPVRL